MTIETVLGQAYIGGAYDFGQNRYGERRGKVTLRCHLKIKILLKSFFTGDLGPAAIAGVIIGAVSVVGALVVTVFFCYYTTNNSRDVSYQNSKAHYQLSDNA